MVGGRAGQRDPQRAHRREVAPGCKFDDAEREALATHDYPKLFELGAHPFLTLTLFIAMFERDYAEPLGFQLEYAQRLSHFTLPYPDIATLSITSPSPASLRRHRVPVGSRGGCCRIG